MSAAPARRSPTTYVRRDHTGRVVVRHVVNPGESHSAAWSAVTATPCTCVPRCADHVAHAGRVAR